MTRSSNRTLLVLGSFALAGCVGGQVSGPDDPGNRVEAEIKAIPKLPNRRVCDQPRAGELACHARIRTDQYGVYALNSSPQGYGPSDLQSAYKLDPAGGGGKTIAIVDAYDDPTAESDLAKYRSTYGLPACTTANGCFKKVNQAGTQGSYPKADAGWSGEIALDLDMASAVCPNCKILLVEANTASMNDLGTSVNTAVKLGATVVSNSYGGGEGSSDAQADTAFFNHPGVAIFASSGDSGYGVEYPAASPYVISVGGTALAKSSNNARGWVESVWGSAANSNGGAGSGCSAFSSKPSWQKDAGCAKRTVADVAAVADPNTGVAVYNAGSWAVYGGTSAASPIVAAVFALTGHGADDGSLIYANTGDFFDVTSGANGSCSGSYLCTGLVGYDGPTGNGTPNGAALAGTSGGSGGGGGTPTPPPPPAMCAHPVCASGAALTPDCDPCATKLCAQDSYCCGTAWDAQCVSEVGSICGQSCAPSGGGGSSCAHSICAAGAKLANSCDACANQVCATDSYCCASAWDNVCVGEVKSICGQTCP